MPGKFAPSPGTLEVPILPAPAGVAPPRQAQHWRWLVTPGMCALRLPGLGGYGLLKPPGPGLSPHAAYLIALILLLIAAVLYASARYRTQADVSRRRIEQALREKTKLWEATFHCMSEGLSYHDPDFTISGANRALCELLGQSHLAGRKCYEMVHGTNAPPDACPMRLSLADGQSHRTEFYEPRVGRYLSVRTDPVKDSTGEIVRIVHMVEDITARFCDQQRIEQLNADLEARVRQRTAELELPTRSWRPSPTLFLTTCGLHCAPSTASAISC